MKTSTSTTTDRDCKVCASSSKYVFSLDGPHTLDLFLCKNCGLLFVGNRITQAQLATLYGELLAKEYYEQIAMTNTQKMIKAAENLSSLLVHGFSKCKLLDVGCGYGHFLDVLRESYPSVLASGQEYPGNSATACENKGHKVFKCALEDITEQFNVIVLLDVAEHVPLPNRTFAACYSLLTKGGYTYIHTPRRCFWDSLFLSLVKMPGLSRLAKLWLRTRVSIYHLHLWTDEALRLSLEKGGFELEYLKSDIDLSWPLEFYVEVYLGKQFPYRPTVTKIITSLIRFLFVTLGTLKNKAICLAKRVEAVHSSPVH